jgi:hypothetical protein
MVQCKAKDGNCCWIAGVVCPFLRDDGSLTDRRWVCTLRESLGSWAAVHADPRYIAVVHPTLMSVGTVDCGDWPGPGITCGECGVTG